MITLLPGERLGAIQYTIGYDDGDGVESGVWYFSLDPKVKQFQKAVRRAIKKYLAENPWTHDYGFNWGDAMSNVDEKYWNAEGLRTIEDPLPWMSFAVDHDEVLHEGTHG